MSIYQLNIYGKDKVETAIERFQRFEPEEGYYLAFSGGKDSVVIKALADMAGVKYDAHYSITSVDPPELVRFVKEQHPDVIRERQYWKSDGFFHKKGDPKTMWNLIPQKLMPPTHKVRYCCRYLKESGGKGRFVVTGVRWAESAKRKNNRSGLELAEKVSTQKRTLYDVDDSTGGLVHITQKMAQRGLNPIIDWSNDEVWQFIKDFRIPYCDLYDAGLNRLGCVGCPLAAPDRDFELFPKYYNLYLHAFDRMLKEREFKGLEKSWKTPEDVMDWYLMKKQ